MKSFKLSIDLLPKGAWGNDLSNTLSEKDWDTLRQYCYNRFHNSCAICGEKNATLHAHEIWEFNKSKQTQTLRDIIALCPKCHGVKHMRNTERIGFGENAKRHFCLINNCTPFDFANHYAEKMLQFEDLNEILRWKVVADLSAFGGKNIEIRQRKLPLIKGYGPHVDGMIWSEISEELTARTTINSINADDIPPKFRCKEVDNYIGTITVSAIYANKCEMLSGKSVIKKQFSTNDRLVAQFSVEDLTANQILFRLTGAGGECYSKTFSLVNATTL